MPSAFACQMSSTAFATGLPSSESTRPETYTSSPFIDAPSRRSAPYSYSFAPCAKNGPSTVASVAPGTVLWLRATIIIERPRMSESRMNSWRLSSHFWPTAVRNLMPSNHSSSVSCTSRAKAWRCVTALVMIWRKRGSSAFFRRATTASVRVSSLNWRMESSWEAKCIIKIPMRLVTFRIGNRPAQPGALADGGRTIVQLAAPSVLAIVEGGQDALDRAAETLARPPREAVFPVADVTLLAPIPQPPQMRDFLCFEKHLQQAFAAVAKLRGTEARIPKIWYERPIFYHPNRFNVCGTGADVPWPRYSERMDFELEFGCYIGK